MPKKVLNNYVYFGNDKITEKSSINSPYLNDFLNNNPEALVTQIANNKIFYIGAKSKLVSKFKNLDITNSLQFEVNKEEFENEFSADNLQISQYENNTKLDQLKFLFENGLRYNFTKKIDITANLNLQQTTFKTEINNSIFLLNPSISLNIKKTGLGNFTLSYSENNTLPQINQLTSNFQLTDYRSFSKGTFYDKPLKNSVARFNYDMYNDEKRFSVNSSLFI